MSDWSEGYMAEIGYTFGYYQELNPQRIKMAFVQAGLVPPEIGNACELGFGQGLTANIHAAASTIQWQGTDFNPSHAGFAQEVALITDNKAHFYDEAFSEFSNRTDLADFDYICLHGIWSWISDENRNIIVDFIRRKLKVGGVLYISYNTMPGWAPMVPFRDLLSEHVELVGSLGKGILPSVDGALEFAEQLLAVNPAYARIYPLISDRLKNMKLQNRNYVAHEYFNGYWLPMSFSKMAEWLAPTKTSFACSANFLDYVDGVNLSKEQQELLSNIQDNNFRQTVRDFIVSQQFRRDYWVKGPRRLKGVEQKALLRKFRFLLINPRADIKLEVDGAVGKITLAEEVYNPILDFLAQHEIKTLAEIEAGISQFNINFLQLFQAIIVMTGAGWLVFVQEANDIAQAKTKTDKLNKYFIEKAFYSSDYTYLSSPVSGGGHMVSRFHQLFLLAIVQGKSQQQEWAALVWQALTAQDQKIIKAGTVLETAAENIEELTSQAQEFADKNLAIYKALQII